MSKWASYRACAECGVVEKSVCRDENNERREEPCSGRQTWSTTDLSRLSRLALERRCAALERRAQAADDLQAEVVRLRKLAKSLYAKVST